MTDKSTDPQAGTDPEEIPDGSGPTEKAGDDTASGGDEDQFQG